MSLLSNSSTFVRYNVEGELPKDNFWGWVGDNVKKLAFKDIDDTFEEISVGWCSVLDMFDSEFAYSSYAVSDYVVLSLRKDERKVPPTILKKFCTKEELRIKKERQIPRLSRGQKLEIKENMLLKLMKIMPPTPYTFDLVWDLAENVVYFYSTNSKAQELVEDVFKETFGQQLLLQVPFTVAQHLLTNDEALNDLTPTIFC